MASLNSQSTMPNTVGGPQAWTELYYQSSNVRILFPLPSRLEFDTAYGWDKEDLGQSGNIVAKIGAGQASGLVNVADLLTATMKAEFYANAGNIANITSAYNRKTANPFSQVLFKNATQREFSMEFSLAAKSASDMQRYLTMLNILYYMSAPALSNGGALFEFPDVCMLSVKEGDTSIIRDRVVAIADIHTDLTPESIYNRFSNGCPPHVIINISFIELFIPTKQTDYQIFGFGDSQQNRLQNLNGADTQQTINSQQFSLTGGQVPNNTGG